MPFNIAFLALNVVVLIWHFAITHRYRLPRGPAWLRLLIAVGIFFLALLASTEFSTSSHVRLFREMQRTTRGVSSTEFCSAGLSWRWPSPAAVFSSETGGCSNFASALEARFSLLPS